ncbi:hypothetical protein G9Q97_06295 [Cyclobacterium sp. GBPx2]|uniref:HTH luxR-type domain-containing protein n=1 Tax=Cyclobacterium plantarum TaxID=2716263 RepID=A0ABX0H3N2_9BACT|nr:hypothetical protein [Cyclobacterium plantarum]
MYWLKKGVSVQQIGEQLFILDKTVRKHLKHKFNLKKN